MTIDLPFASKTTGAKPMDYALEDFLRKFSQNDYERQKYRFVEIILTRSLTQTSEIPNYVNQRFTD